MQLAKGLSGPFVGIGGAVVGGLAGFCAGPEGDRPEWGGAGLGEVVNVCIDLHHLHKCQQKVNQMEQAAEKAKKKCLKKATDK